MAKSVDELDAEFQRLTFDEVVRELRAARAEINFLSMEIRRTAASTTDRVAKNALLGLLLGSPRGEPTTGPLFGPMDRKPF